MSAKSAKPPVAPTRKPPHNKTRPVSRAEKCASCGHRFSDDVWSQCDPTCKHHGPLKVGRVVADVLDGGQGTAGEIAALRPGEVFAAGRQRDGTSDRCQLCVRRGGPA